MEIKVKGPKSFRVFQLWSTAFLVALLLPMPFHLQAFTSSHLPASSSSHSACSSPSRYLRLRMSTGMEPPKVLCYG
ncbi:carbohydrate kinase [Nannochloropsis gaditana]|uniref:Carbohydrate kinase n=1 Tax=Nannochloropsis gaditana TaxID=72520 RepID=W7TSG8_9STRA|nr:carbohydrate kinase [Nannochloropsis gaditana]